MKTNLGSLDYNYYKGSILEEIVQTLLDGNKDRLDDVVSVMSEDNGIYVEIIRRKGSARRGIVKYKRFQQKKLRSMTDEEEKMFSAFLKHPLTYSHGYNHHQLVQSTGEGNGLANILRVLEGNGYSLINAKVYHMPSPFDLTPVVVVTKLYQANGTRNTIQGHYVVDSNPSYVRTNEVAPR